MPIEIDMEPQPICIGSNITVYVTLADDQSRTTNVTATFNNGKIFDILISGVETIIAVLTLPPTRIITQRWTAAIVPHTPGTFLLTKV